MHDFGHLVYMDMHKTGSTQTSDFLAECCTLDLVHFKKHQFLQTRRRPRAYYFTTIRNPLSAYVSLFRYGLDGKGGYFQRMSRKGFGDLYRKDARAFEDWLAVTLHPDHMTGIYAGLSTFLGLGMGLQSARHMLFSLEKPKKRIEQCATKAEAMALFDNRKITSLVIPLEGLNAGLMDLATQLKPEFFDQARVENYFAASKDRRVNRSKSDLSGDIQLSDAMLETLYDRERLIFDRYYGGADGLQHANAVTLSRAG